MKTTRIYKVNVILDHFIIFDRFQPDSELMSDQRGIYRYTPERYKRLEALIPKDYKMTSITWIDQTEYE